MPPVNLTGDVGAQLDLTADFEVADVAHLTDFTRTLLTEKSFEWEISGENLTVSAIGTNRLVDLLSLASLDKQVLMYRESHSRPRTSP